MADLEDLMSALVDLYTVDNTRIGAHFASISHSRCMCVAVVGGRSAGWDVWGSPRVVRLGHVH